MVTFPKNLAKTEPAPALTRGLQLLEILAQDGQSSLEILVKKTGWPKSSVWRYLQALESIEAVGQDALTKHWVAREVLRPIDSISSVPMEKARRLLPVWANETNCCVELYEVESGRMTLIDRAEPENELVAIRARIGFERNVSELDATALNFFAFQNAVLPPSKVWVWNEGRRHKLGVRISRMRIDAVRESGWAQDNDFNEHGFRRFARPVLDNGQLIGVMAIAQRQTPLAEREKPAIIKTLQTNPNL